MFDVFSYLPGSGDLQSNEGRQLSDRDDRITTKCPVDQVQRMKRTVCDKIPKTVVLEITVDEGEFVDVCEVNDDSSFEVRVRGTMQMQSVQPFLADSRSFGPDACTTGQIQPAKVGQFQQQTNSVVSDLSAGEIHRLKYWVCLRAQQNIIIHPGAVIQFQLLDRVQFQRTQQASGGAGSTETQSVEFG